jgi:hypothetical protein
MERAEDPAGRPFRSIQVVITKVHFCNTPRFTGKKKVCSPSNALALGLPDLRVAGDGTCVSPNRLENRVLDDFFHDRTPEG